jgi:uncharacterized membrane protein
METNPSPTSTTALGLEQKVGALLCYVNICLPIGLVYSLIVVLTDKTNKLPRFHAFQSLLLTAAMLVVVVGLVIFQTVLVILKLGILATLVSLGQLVIGLGCLALTILCAVKAYSGECFKLPLLGDFAEKWAQPA